MSAGLRLPLVTVIVPCRNEGAYIAACLDSIMATSYPLELLEALVVDGESSDQTAAVVSRYSGVHAWIRLLRNERKIVPSALNIGIRNARGAVIIRMDAHCVYPPDYIPACVRALQESGADNVGGRCVTLPSAPGAMAGSIAAAMSHAFGVGNSWFRIGAEEPRYVDTVPFGCYRREVFERIGMFDEDLVRNQDDEFNLRLVRSGGRILLVPSIVTQYFARDTLAKAARMFYQYGYFKPLVNLKVGAVMTGRQLVPALFVASLAMSAASALFVPRTVFLFAAVLGAYVCATAGVSLRIAARQGARYFFCMPLAFAALHFGYGAGYLRGILDFMVLKKTLLSRRKEIPLTR